MTRTQLTLFVEGPWAERLAAVRRSLDPVQAGLIAAHVTLCREDEIDGISPSSIQQRIESWTAGPLHLAFGQPRRFDGHGVLMPCTDGSVDFQRLRRWLLLDACAREHDPHLTLAHPRNPRSAGNTDAALAAVPACHEFVFGSVTLIEQRGTDPWRLLQVATLGRGSLDAATSSGCGSVPVAHRQHEP